MKILKYIISSIAMSAIVITIAKYGLMFDKNPFNTAIRSFYDHISNENEKKIRILEDKLKNSEDKVLKNYSKITELEKLIKDNEILVKKLKLSSISYTNGMNIYTILSLIMSIFGLFKAMNLHRVKRKYYKSREKFNKVIKIANEKVNELHEESGKTLKFMKIKIDKMNESYERMFEINEKRNTKIIKLNEINKNLIENEEKILENLENEIKEKTLNNIKNIELTIKDCIIKMEKHILKTMQDVNENVITSDNFTAKGKEQLNEIYKTGIENNAKALQVNPITLGIGGIPSGIILVLSIIFINELNDLNLGNIIPNHIEYIHEMEIPYLCLNDNYESMKKTNIEVPNYSGIKIDEISVIKMKEINTGKALKAMQKALNS